MRTLTLSALFTATCTSLLAAPAAAGDGPLAAEVRALLATRYAPVATAADVRVVPVPRPKPPEWPEVKAEADGQVWLSAEGAADWEVLDPGATILAGRRARPRTGTGRRGRPRAGLSRAGRAMGGG